MKKSVEEILKQAGISPTPIRILVYKCIQESEKSLSLADIELRLDTVDKSSVSRSLNLFREYHLVHAFNDGSGSMKYELCKSDIPSNHDDLHVHFHCNSCGETFCLTSTKVPEVSLPPGFIPQETNYVIMGICADCSKL